jgi:hypothetical protein
VAASGTRVFAAWVRAGSRQLVGRASIDGGTSWASPQVLGALAPNPGATGPLSAPFSIAARPDRMAVAWSGGWPADSGHPQVFVRVFAAGTWGVPSAITLSADIGDSPYGYVSSPAVTLLASTRVGLGFVVCSDLRAIDPIYQCSEPYGGAFRVMWAESASNGTSWTAPTDINGGPLVWVGSIAAVWPSANIRTVAAWWATGETEWISSVYLYRGSTPS